MGLFIFIDKIMTKIDIYSQIKTVDKTIDLKENLVTLFDKLLKEDNLSSVKKQKLAGLRAKIEIILNES